MNYTGHKEDLNYFTNDTRFTGLQYSEFQHTLLKSDEGEGLHLHIWVYKTTPHNTRIKAANRIASKLLNVKPDKPVISWSYDYVPEDA